MARTIDVLQAAHLAFFDNVPTAHILQTTAQTIHNSTDTAIIFNFARVDTWAGWESGKPTRYTAVVPGLYAMSSNVIWAAVATNRRYSYFKVNGTSQVPGSASDIASTLTNNLTVVTPTVVQYLNVGDYVEVYASQDTGSDLATNGSGQSSAFLSSMTLTWLRN